MPDPRWSAIGLIDSWGAVRGHLYAGPSAYQMSHEVVFGRCACAGSLTWRWREGGPIDSLSSWADPTDEDVDAIVRWIEKRVPVTHKPTHGY